MALDDYTYNEVAQHGLFNFLLAEVAEIIWAQGNAVADVLSDKKWTEL